MSTPQASLLSQITGIIFAGEDDPRLQTHAKDLCDDFRLDALRLEAAAESRLLEEVDRIRQQFCAPMESIDYHYRLLATDHSLRSSPAYFVGGQPSQTLELKFHQPAASAPAVADEDGPAAVAAAINVPIPNEGPDAVPNPPVTTTNDEDANLPPAPLQRSRSLQEEFACCICLNLMYEPTSLACGHSGCLSCMKRAVRTKPQCPVCKARVQHELTVTIALRTAIKRLCPEYGPAVDAMTASTVAASLAGGVDLRGSLGVVCRHLGLRYEESNDTVEFVLSDAAVKRSFSHANLPFRRLLEDSRMVHPVYAEGVVEQHKQLFMRMVAGQDTPCHSITSIPAAIVDTLMRPLLVKAGPYRDWINAEHERFYFALATMTGVAWEPLQSTIAFDQWLPRRLLQKLCRRAGCLMETSLALMELRTELRKFLEALLTVAHELQKHRNESLITCDTLLRSLPRLYSGNRADLRVFGYGVVGNIRHLLGAQLATVLLKVHPTLMLDEVAMSAVHDLVVTTMLDVAGFAKAQSMQCGRLSATLKCGDAAAGEADQRRSWEYSVYEVSADGTESVGDVLPVVTMDDVLMAIRTIVSGDLARHAISECAKAIAKYRERNATNYGAIPPGMEMRQWTGLVFAPESIALIVDTYFGVGDVRLTMEALICLATLTEYLSAELLELSGNAAKDFGFNVISPYHLSLIILFDGELLRLYPGMIRYGCHLSSPTVGFNAVNATSNTSLMQTVDAYLASLVSTGAVVPHLLCGRFVGPNDSDVPGTESPFMLLPVFDCLAYPKLGEAKRQVMAIEAAPLEVQQAVERIGADVASTWRRRLLELKREQRHRPMLPLFTHETMFALSDQVMHGLGVPTMLTTEAIDLLATVSESFMVSVVRDAYLMALQAKRYVLEPSDIQMARRLRGERA
eukprot:gene16766-11996_t